MARAVERGSHETAVPRLLALVCVLSVFIPAFIMAEPIRSLFVPLALAVGFAMVSSYVLSSTFVPVISVWLIKHHGEHHAEGCDSTGIVRSVSESCFGGWVQTISLNWRWIVVPAYRGRLPCLVVRCRCVGSQLGTELFPQVDSGEFVLRFRAPPGSNFEITRQIAVKTSASDRRRSQGRKTSTSRWASPASKRPVYSMNNLILFMRGPDDGQLRIALEEDSGIRLEAVPRAIAQGTAGKGQAMAGRLAACNKG